MKHREIVYLRILCEGLGDEQPEIDHDVLWETRYLGGGTGVKIAMEMPRWLSLLIDAYKRRLVRRFQRLHGLSGVMSSAILIDMADEPEEDWSGLVRVVSVRK
jgi:hypothetical protein